MEIHGRSGEHDRRIRLPGTTNLRDLGGYPTTDGQTVRWRTLLRSDALHWLDDSGRALLAGVGLRTVIDLRTAEEASAAPSALHRSGLRILHVPLFSTSAIGGLPPDLAALYSYMIDECGASIAEAVGRLCAGDALPGLIHCTAGKDRTGLVAALLLALADVVPEAIAYDYALSSTNLRDGYLQRYAHRDPQQILAALHCPEEGAYNMLKFLAHAGGVRAYLRDIGLASEEIAALHARLRE